MGKPRVRMLPEDRREQIVRVAQSILVERGGAEFTLRAVAAGCSVSLAAIQHHFTDKGTLFRAVIESIVKDYDRRYTEAMSASDREPETRLRQFLEFLIYDDIKARPTAGFFYELWAMAFRDPMVHDAMTRLYDLQLLRVREMITMINPRVKELDALARAAVIVAATDGLMLTIGAEKDSVLVREAVSETAIVDAMMNIVWQASDGEALTFLPVGHGTC